MYLASYPSFWGLGLLICLPKPYAHPYLQFVEKASKNDMRWQVLVVLNGGSTSYQAPPIKVYGALLYGAMTAIIPHDRESLNDLVFFI